MEQLLGEQLAAAGLLGGGMQQETHRSGRQSGPPATGKAALRALPKIKVTAHDIEVNETSECSICLDELVVGQPALRIPCGHLYHEDCVKDWLIKSNECPSCRYELPTDDPEYERGRRERMAGRKLRMRRGDLTVRSAQELRRLADHLGVDVRGCLEKAELVEAIAKSSQVQIIPARGAGADAEEMQTETPGLRIYSQAQLDAMGTSELKALMVELGVDAPEDLDDAERRRQLAHSGRIIVSAAVEASMPSDEGKRNCQCPGGGRPASAPGAVEGDRRRSDGPLAERSIGELRRLAQQLGVSLDGCLEKGDLVQRIEAAQPNRT